MSHNEVWGALDLLLGAINLILWDTGGRRSTANLVIGVILVVFGFGYLA